MSENALNQNPIAKVDAATMKNFRHHPEIENFYRFIYENDLRFEALEILDLMIDQKRTEIVAQSISH